MARSARVLLTTRCLILLKLHGESLRNLISPHKAGRSLGLVKELEARIPTEVHLEDKVDKKSHLQGE